MFRVIFQSELKYENDRTSIRCTLTRALLIFHAIFRKTGLLTREELKTRVVMLNNGIFVSPDNRIQILLCRRDCITITSLLLKQSNVIIYIHRDTQEFIDKARNAYIGYNIHINGLFHCTARYKQLYNLHIQLSKDLDMLLPIFPPKKFFPLTATQQEERRLALEKYIQSIGQNITINNSEILNGFLLSAQQESADGLTELETLDIFLMNG